MGPYTLINIIFIICIIIALLIFLFIRLSTKKEAPRIRMVDEQKYQLSAIMNYVRETMNEITTVNLYDLGLSEEEFKRRANKRKELKRALKGCNSGDLNDKVYIKAFIFDLLAKTYGFNEQTINIPIPFHRVDRLTDQDKFEILLYLYKKRYGYHGLSKMIESYHLDREKRLNDESDGAYIITRAEIDQIFAKEAPQTLTFEDKLQIIVQRVYQMYKGFGVVDEIRDMHIDGVSGGVSGFPAKVETFDDEELVYDAMCRSKPSYLQSVWIFYKGKTIHLSFLSFSSEAELKRVCQNIYKYNHPGQLSDTKGYMVNEMKDGSRVVVVRPRFAESWAFFVRKFDVAKMSLEQLIVDSNHQLPISMIKFLMKGARVTAITGAQGSGKTTLLMSAVKHMYSTLTLRVQEMAFELHLRNIYPERNILTFRETDSISGQEGLDVQKKTDGSVNILGEVATDPVAAWMIQMSQVASLFTVFTHHAKTFQDLVFSLRNSLLKTGMFNHEKIAEQQVVSVINFDIHLKRDYDGKRYIERITECIPTVQDEHPYPETWKQASDFQDQVHRFMETMTEYFHRQTDRKSFVARNIIEYRDGRYVAVHPISARNVQEMTEQMKADDAEAFQHFLDKHWGREGTV